MSNGKKVPPSGPTLKPSVGKIVESSYTGPKPTAKSPAKADKRGK